MKTDCTVGAVWQGFSDQLQSAFELSQLRQSKLRALGRLVQMSFVDHDALISLAELLHVTVDNRYHTAPRHTNGSAWKCTVWLASVTYP